MPEQPARSRARNIAVSLAFVVFGGPGIVALYVPAYVTRWRVPPEPLYLRVLAVALLVAGVLPLGESVARFVWQGKGTLVPTHPTAALVVRGFYRYVRNPMYIGVLMLIAGQAILFRSRWLGWYAVCVAIGFHLFVVLYEERTLRRKYGEAFAEYCEQVPRWMPRRLPPGTSG